MAGGLLVEAELAHCVRDGTKENRAGLNVDVVLATPHRYTADLFARLLEGHAFLRPAGWARTGEEVSRLIEAAEEALVLVDATLSGGLNLCRSEAGPGRRVRYVALGVSETPPEIVRWLRAGACAYISAERGLHELVEHLDEISRARQHAAPDVVGAVFEHFSRAHAGVAHDPILDVTPRVSLDVLTARELEIARRLASGASNKIIARELDISLATIKSHVHSILRKMSLQNRRDLASAFDADERFSQVV